MPASITDIVSSIGLNPDRIKTSKWGESIASSSIGIYFISLSKDPNKNDNNLNVAPIDADILKFWINKVATIKVDGNTATVDILKNRLSSFWLPDENIIYIGQTESSKGLRVRIRQFYNTEIGERKPHAGGHWIKTLINLNQMYVHYISVQHPLAKEKELMHTFVSQVSESTKKLLHDPNLPLPFANLELEQGQRKSHGISNSKLR